jgi:hypothetical protein
VISCFLLGWITPKTVKIWQRKDLPFECDT